MCPDCESGNTVMQDDEPGWDVDTVWFRWKCSDCGCEFECVFAYQYSEIVERGKGAELPAAQDVV